MPTRIWQAEFLGRNAGSVCVGSSWIAFSYIDDQGQPGSPGPHVLATFDLEGRELWRVRDHSAALVLPGDRLLALSDDGQLSLFDGAGHRLHGLRTGRRGGCSAAVRSVSRQKDRVLVWSEKVLLVADLDLQVIERHARPEKATTWVAFAEGGFLWVEGNTLMRSVGGRATPLAPIPTEAAEEAMRRFEEETGTPALGGMVRFELPVPFTDGSQLVDALKQPDKAKPFGLGERFGNYLWTLDVDHDERLIFLSNLHPPHVVLCLDFEGNLRWANYLSAACCGGTPVPLPNGLYVASSGCGGILSWMTSDGHVLYRSEEPRPGIGLAGAFTHRLKVLSDSRCLVDGGPGIVAFGPDGRQLWAREGCGDFDINEEAEVIAVASWAATLGEPHRVSLQCLRGLDE